MPADLRKCCVFGNDPWALRDSNPRHPPCKGGALPAELNARTACHGSATISGHRPGVGTPEIGWWPPTCDGPRRTGARRGHRGESCPSLVTPARQCGVLGQALFSMYIGTASTTGSGGATFRWTTPASLLGEHLAVREGFATPDAPGLARAGRPRRGTAPAPGSPRRTPWRGECHRAARRRTGRRARTTRRRTRPSTRQRSRWMIAVCSTANIASSPADSLCWVRCRCVVAVSVGLVGCGDRSVAGWSVGWTGRNNTKRPPGCPGGLGVSWSN